MAFFFVCGSHTFSSLLQGYENVTVRCANCGNYSARCYKRWQWFTFCFIPIIPFSFKPWHDVGCHICNFHQDMATRPDVEDARAGRIQQGGGGGPGGPGPGGPPGQEQYQMQGWNQPHQPNQGPPPGQVPPYK